MKTDAKPSRNHNVVIIQLISFLVYLMKNVNTKQGQITAKP